MVMSALRVVPSPRGTRTCRVSGASARGPADSRSARSTVLRIRSRIPRPAAPGGRVPRSCSARRASSSSSPRSVAVRTRLPAAHSPSPSSSSGIASAAASSSLHMVNPARRRRKALAGWVSTSTTSVSGTTPSSHSQVGTDSRWASGSSPVPAVPVPSAPVPAVPAPVARGPAVTAAAPAAAVGSKPDRAEARKAAAAGSPNADGSYGWSG
ncbi:hypothetical protein SDC9_151222 [bioreactor metagenome]|uniref:Uncharacterized protein n=1 Tax=bioreactor metagenome TaxID=1076179 RepID=A0A645EQ82_9ZZZZ